MISVTLKLIFLNNRFINVSNDECCVPKCKLKRLRPRTAQLAVNRSLSLRHLKTLQECWSRPLIGWIIQDFRETCVSRSLTFCLETKMPWSQTLSRKKKAVVFTTVTPSAYQGQLNAGVSEVSSSLKYIREFHTPVCNYGDISTNPKRDAERIELWLVAWHVSHGRGLTNETLPSIPDLQPLRETKWIETKNSRDAPIWTLWPIPIILYIWKPITDMLADKSISKFLYSFWEPDLKIRSHH